jgi:hypothetical protein
MSARNDIMHQLRQVAGADRSGFVVFSGTRTDYRGNRNTLSTARRVLREIAS